jgi:membrane protein DedA with SNARE-associated domain
VADALLDALAALPTLPTYLVLMALSAIENVFPPVPADVAVALGAFLARRGEIHASLLWILCWGANTASSAAMYFLARAYGPGFLEMRWPRKLLPPEAVGALREAYERHGVAGIFWSRFLPGLRAAVTPFAGVVGMSPARALVPAASASAIWYALLIVAGLALGRSWEAVKQIVSRANSALGLLAVVATVLLALHFWRVMRARRSG